MSVENGTIVYYVCTGYAMHGQQHPIIRANCFHLNCLPYFVLFACLGMSVDTCRNNHPIIKAKITL